MFTDVKGSTLLIQDPTIDGNRRLIQTQDTVRALLSGSGGQEVHCAGDGFFFVFTHAPDALRGALEVQHALQSGAAQVRIGMHTGNAVMWGGEYMGIDVHRAARIAAAAHGGQILLSGSTRALVRSPVTDLGIYQLKDIADPIHLYQAGEGAFGPIACVGTSNLPPPATEFVGRAKELAYLDRLLGKEGARLVTLTGPGGIGKTRLALQVARLRSTHYPDGAWWIDLTTVRDARLVPETVGRVIGSTGDLAQFIGRKRCALVLDNFEHVLEAAGYVGELVSRCENLVALVTSRASLCLSSEWRFDLEPLSDSDAVTLFCARALATGRDVRRTAQVRAICRRVENVPLALELAAAKCLSLSASELLSRLDDRLDFLSAAVDDLPDRHRTLRATVQWSYELLHSDERRAFLQLCVFAGGWSAEVALLVFNVDLSVLEGLIKKSFVRVVEGRFHMLEVIREFGIERLEDDPEAAFRTRSAHRDYFLALAERHHQLQTASPSDWLPSFQALGREHENILAALQFSGQAMKNRVCNDAALRFCAALRLYWTSRWHCREGLRACRSALAERPPNVDPAVVARVLCTAASLSSFVGDLDRAGPLYEEALSLFNGQGLRKEEAMVASDAGHLEYMLGHFDAAKSRFAHLSHLALELGDEKLAANAEYGVARVALAEKQHDISRRFFESALAGYVRVGHQSNQALALLNLGMLAYAGRDLTAARVHLTRALTLIRDVGDEMIENSIVRCLGDVEASSGNVPVAKALLKQALESNWQTDDMLEVTLCLRSAAMLSFRAGNLNQGAVLLGSATHMDARFERLLGALLTQEEGALLDAARESLAGDFDAHERLGAAMSASAAIDAAIRYLSHGSPGSDAPLGGLPRKRAGVGLSSRRRRRHAEMQGQKASPVASTEH